MKYWWLNLYTIPMLKNIAKNAAICLTLGILASFVVPDLPIEVYWPINLYVIVRVYFDNRKSLGENIEFHKLNVPYPELRRAFLLDTAIKISAAIFACNLNFWIVQSMLGTSDTGASFWIALFYIVVALLTVNFKGMSGIEPTYKMMGKDVHFIKRFLVNSFFWFASVILLFTAAAFGFPIVTIFVILLGSFSFGVYHYCFRALFHQEKKTGSPRTYLKYTFKSLGVGTVAFIVFVFATKPLVHVDYLSGGVRSQLYQMSGPFADELDVETAKDFMKISLDRRDLGNILSLNPQLAQLPITDIFLKPTVGNFEIYLTHSQNPSKENLIYILETQKRAKKFYPMMESNARKVVALWPKAEKFPDHLIDARISLKDNRAPASKR